jgi:deoxyribodipyrimidine photolyase-related protein
MAQMYRTWDRMDEGRRATVLAEADGLLERLDAGGTI